MFKSQVNWNNLESIIKVEPEQFEKNTQNDSTRQLLDEILKSKANM